MHKPKKTFRAPVNLREKNLVTEEKTCWGEKGGVRRKKKKKERGGGGGEVKAHTKMNFPL